MERLRTATVVIADDQAVARRGVRTLFQATAPHLKVVAEAGDGVEAVGLTERFSPDVLVTDLQMPRMGGVDVARQVSQQFPSTRVVIYSMHAIEAYAIEAFRAGALGYVVKEMLDDNDLVRAVGEALQGRRFLSASLSQHLLEVYAVDTGAKPADACHTLSIREQEFLRLFACRTPYEEIAAVLNVSQKTVEYYHATLTRKLALRNHKELARYAMTHGIIKRLEP